MHYYAFYHDYGVNMRYAADNLPAGTLHVFSSRRSRDEWVSDERYEGGNVHRDVMGSREARRLLVNYVAANALEWAPFVDAQYTIDELIDKAREHPFDYVDGVCIHEEGSDER